MNYTKETMMRKFLSLLLLISLVASFSLKKGLLQHKRSGLHVVLANVALSNKSFKGNIGSFQIIADEMEVPESDNRISNEDDKTIYLLNVGSGWGNGAHPTTRLCLDFVARNVRKGDSFLDYGTGSGILSIAAAKLGATHCVAVDIDEDTLLAARRNAEINGVSDKLDIVHTKLVYIGEDRFPVCDVTVANILPVSADRVIFSSSVLL
jgi:ribosomal protein L11 methylase PrmA